MSKDTTKKNNKKTKDLPVFALAGMKVANVRKLSDTVTAFSLLGNGLGLYNLKVVDGAKGKFIGVPQSKGKDGSWYNQYAVYFSDEDQAKIIKKVESMVEDEDDDEDEDEELPF